MALELSAVMREQTMHIVGSQEASADSDSGIAMRKTLLCDLVQLRAANRDLWQQSRSAKAATAEAKSGIDQLNLELQGLYYQQRHLRNEIKLCQETPTIYDQIQLMDESEFLEHHPELRELNARDMMHERLKHEKTERLKLEDLRRELAARKSTLIAENKKRKTELESLENQLATFVQAAENISSIFKKY